MDQNISIPCKLVVINFFLQKVYILERQKSEGKAHYINMAQIKVNSPSAMFRVNFILVPGFLSATSQALH